eukprot:6597137-Prymnesium_polylepis.2
MQAGPSLPHCASILVHDGILALEGEDEHVVDLVVHHDRRRVGRLEVAVRDRGVHRVLVLRANGAAELPGKGAELLRVGREDEAGERGLVDER